MEDMTARHIYVMDCNIFYGYHAIPAGVVGYLRVPVRMAPARTA